MLKKTILIIDYKVGNIQSIENALNVLGYNYICSSDKKDIENAYAYILPGVGAFAAGIENLKRLKLVDILEECIVKQCRPLIGICLGMQLLAEQSEEKGVHKGLGWIQGEVVSLNPDTTPKIPHVGWNSLKIKRSGDAIISRVEKDTRFYFDHSYYFRSSDEYCLATTEYGSEVTAVVKNGNIYGVQFHPEKSQVAGLKLLRDFFVDLGFPTYDDLNNKTINHDD